MALPARLDRRVERAAPRPADDLEVPGRVGARTDRPDHLVQVGYVHVVVHHDDDPAEVGAGPALRRDVTCLDGMPRITLPDRDDVEQPAAAHAMAPRRGDVGYPGPAHLAAEVRAAQVLAEPVRLERRFLRRD